MKKTRRDMFVIGFALFSMFFGAGNVIFPPYLGLEAGPKWMLGFACYYLADIGLALMALFAMLRCGGAEGITSRIGKVPSAVLMSAIVLCIGPMVAIPRTAATTYEMSVAPLFDGVSSVVFCVRESAVVDIVGKVLTPALLLGLMILIVKGVVDPMGPVATVPQVVNVPATGIKAGYQTMDVLAAMVFGIIILKSAADKGHTDRKSQSAVVAGAGIVAGMALLVVYVGLTYLGASASEFFDISVNRSELVVSIVRSLLGQAGVIIFGIVVALACVTTAVALVSSAASFFSKQSGGRVSYRTLVIGVCAFSAVASNVGLDQIVAIASPVLDIVYPPTLVLIVLSFFGSRLKNDNIFRLAALGALLTSLLSTVSTFGVALPLLNHLPFASLGFGWVVPSVAFGLVGSLMGEGGSGGGDSSDRKTRRARRRHLQDA